MTFLLRYLSTDEGNCRVYYQTRNARQERLLYCLMQTDNKGTIECFRCSQDGEPSYAVPIAGFIFHYPKIADRSAPTKLEIYVNNYLDILVGKVKTV